MEERDVKEEASSEIGERRDKRQHQTILCLFVNQLPHSDMAPKLIHRGHPRVPHVFQRILTIIVEGLGQCNVVSRSVPPTNQACWMW
eukprot:357274-Chlamydomonas_euryale.AAC.11